MVIEGIYLPSNLRSPAKDGRELVNNEEGNGTEIGTFMPTWTKPNSSQIRSGKPINQNYQNSIKYTIPIMNRICLAYILFTSVKTQAFGYYTVNAYTWTSNTV